MTEIEFLENLKHLTLPALSRTIGELNAHWWENPATGEKLPVMWESFSCWL